MFRIFFSWWITVCTAIWMLPAQAADSNGVADGISQYLLVELLLLAMGALIVFIALGYRYRKKLKNR